MSFIRIVKKPKVCHHNVPLLLTDDIDVGTVWLCNRCGVQLILAEIDINDNSIKFAWKEMPKQDYLEVPSTERKNEE